MTPSSNGHVNEGELAELAIRIGDTITVVLSGIGATQLPEMTLIASSALNLDGAYRVAEDGEPGEMHSVIIPWASIRYVTKTVTE